MSFHRPPPRPGRSGARVTIIATLVVVLAMIVVPTAAVALGGATRSAPVVSLSRSDSAVQGLADGRVAATTPSSIAAAMPAETAPEPLPGPPPTAAAPVPTSATTTSTTTTTAPAQPVRTSVDFGDGLLAEVVAPPTDGPHPTLVYVHGGGWVEGSHLELPPELSLDRMPDRGWAVASIGYRLAARDRGVDAGDQLADVARVIEWIRTGATELGLGGRVVGVGHSAGGHLLTLAAVTMDPALAPDTVVGAAGIYDFGPDIQESELLAQVLPDALGCEPSECPQEWIDSLTPGTHARSGGPRVILVHGTSDHVVPHRTADDFAALLTQRGVRTDLMSVDGAGHYDSALAGAIRGAIDRALAG